MVLNKRLSWLVMASILSGLAAIAVVFVPVLYPYQQYVITPIAIMAPLVIWRRDIKAKVTENLNGNIIKLVIAIEKMSQFRKDHIAVWHSLPPVFRSDYRELQHLLGNIATINQGFRDLKWLQEREVKEYEEEDRQASLLDTQKLPDRDE